MSHTQRLDEPSTVWVDGDRDPREDRPSYDELTQANETLARQVSRLSAEKNVLLAEVEDLKRLLIG